MGVESVFCPQVETGASLSAMPTRKNRKADDDDDSVQFISPERKSFRAPVSWLPVTCWIQTHDTHDNPRRYKK